MFVLQSEMKILGTKSLANKSALLHNQEAIFHWDLESYHS